MFSWLKLPSLKKFIVRESGAESFASEPVVIPRSEHCISRSQISDNALKVLYRLQRAGYQAYLVGGGVRDLLLGREPKDFDVATDARPEEVRGLFRNCRLIGRRFRLAHVHFGPEIIEVATFRGRSDGEDQEAVSEEGMLLRDNVYGSLEEDAWRRDLSVNALYYNIADYSVVDYTGGMADLRTGRLRVIGDAEVRFREDPVRMLRAVRFAAKLGFRLDAECEAAIVTVGPMLQQVAPARLFDELLKLFLAGHAVATYELLRHYNLFGYLLPETEQCLAEEEGGFPHTFVLNALKNTDQRIADNKPVTPAFLFAALLWEPVRAEARRLQQDESMGDLQALQQGGDIVFSRQQTWVSVPKRFSLQSREIWTLQARLTNRSGKRPNRLLEHPRFRAGYDFLLLRSESGDDVDELARWWTDFQQVDEGARAQLLQAAPSGQRRRKRRRRPRTRKPASQE